MAASTTTSASYTCQSNEPTYGNIEFDVTRGSDDARLDTEIDAQVSVSAGKGSTLTLVLKASGDGEWTSSNTPTKVFPLNPPVAALDLAQARITLVEHDQGVETDDNSDMDSLRVLLYNQTTAKKCGHRPDLRQVHREQSDLGDAAALFPVSPRRWLLLRSLQLPDHRRHHFVRLTPS